MEALEKHQLAIQKIDKALETIDFQIIFHIDKVSVEMTGNKSDYYGNSKLMSFGFENQGFTVSKNGAEMKINMFGVTLGTYNQFEELYKFVMRTKNTVSSIKDNITNQLDQEAYVQQMKEVIENAKHQICGSKSDVSAEDIQVQENDFSQLYRKKPNPPKKEEEKLQVPQQVKEGPRPTATFGGPIDFGALASKNQIKPSGMVAASAMPARGGENSRPVMSSGMPSRGGDMSLKAPKSQPSQNLMQPKAKE